MADRPQVSRRGTSPNSGRAATAAFVHYRFVAAIFRSRQNGTQCTHLPTSDRRRCRAFSQSVRALLRRRIITSRRQKMMHSHRGHFCPWLPWIGSGSIFAGKFLLFSWCPLVPPPPWFQNAHELCSKADLPMDGSVPCNSYHNNRSALRHR